MKLKGYNSMNDTEIHEFRFQDTQSAYWMFVQTNAYNQYRNNVRILDLDNKCNSVYFTALTYIQALSLLKCLQYREEVNYSNTLDNVRSIIEHLLDNY